MGERKSEGKNERRRDRARHLEDWQYSLFMLTPLTHPPIPPLLLSFTFLTLLTPPPSGICFRFEPVLQPYLSLICASRQKTESSMFPCIRLPAPDTPLENLTAPQNGWAGKKTKQNKKHPRYYLIKWRLDLHPNQRKCQLGKLWKWIFGPRTTNAPKSSII